jgi:hypothetical protein
MTMPESEIPGSLTIVLGYRPRCTECACRNLGGMILRYADAGGRPMSNAEFCHAQADRGMAERVIDSGTRPCTPSMLSCRPIRSRVAPRKRSSTTFTLALACCQGRRPGTMIAATKRPALPPPHSA